MVVLNWPVPVSKSIDSENQTRLTKTAVNHIIAKSLTQGYISNSGLLQIPNVKD